MNERQGGNIPSNKANLIEWLLNEYGTEIKRLAFLYVKDQSLTEDILQEVFISCYKNIDSFRDESSYKTWLIRITINKCKDSLKRWSFRNLVYRGEIDLVYDLNSPEKQTVSEAEGQLLMKEVLDLPLKFREVIILFYYQDMTIDEISKLLEINQNTVKSRLHRARTKLKGGLVRRGFNG
ncbi:sigma-70 family RNA polymerase sigma factor [Litchfieldia salsa]|uniref:RNA polymerase sigma-70 factor, ECF subfamily n=1 Tax=Litchfieldia salsa TaxID=930152 RepID=A0A1H0SZV5_9BACI|nr:sigma-70 family RNA polymerase sigma factor [Litchfieldia salsa]SDP47091.1 RNA polymerase sigma-70 factor, ECF subfamily [Litchfieldia salsa]